MLIDHLRTIEIHACYDFSRAESMVKCSRKSRHNIGRSLLIHSTGPTILLKNNVILLYGLSSQLGPLLPLGR